MKTMVLAVFVLVEVVQANFRDNFENYSTQAQMEAKWTQLGANKALLATNDSINRVPSNGTKFQTAPATGSFRSQYNFSRDFGRYCIWFYDHNEPNHIAEFLLMPYQANTAGVGVAHVYWWDSANYVAYDAATFQTVAVAPRSLGWHQIVWELTNPGVKVYLDGKLAVTVDATHHSNWNQFSAGADSFAFENRWSNGSTSAHYYIDGFSHASAPPFSGIVPAAVLNASGFSVKVTTGGGMVIHSGTEAYAVESDFSYPSMPNSASNRLAVSNTSPPGGEWTVQVSGDSGTARINAVGSYYRLVRTISISGGRCNVQDNVTNISGQPIGIAFDHGVTPAGKPTAINIGGRYVKAHNTYDAGNVATNPTIFFANPQGSLGMLAIDDFLRLQLGLQQEGRTGLFHDENFGLPSGDSHVFSWALYPTAGADYYDFINKVRADYVPNYPLEGSLIWMPYTQPAALGPTNLSAYLTRRSAKIVILCGPYSGGPWLGEDSNYIYHVPDFNLDTYLTDLKNARALIKAVAPDVKCIAPFETALSPDSAAGDLTPAHADSVSILPDGGPAIYYNVNPVTSPHQYIYYPTRSNSYYGWIRDRVQRALTDAQMDGIYFDIFPYAGGGTYGFRWTYDRWDNRTVDLDPANYTIRRTKADLCKLSEDARADIVSLILNGRPGNVVVANGMGITEKIRALPIMHFSETIFDDGYVANHFSTPIVLGWVPGYNFPGLGLLKPGTWWQTWSSDRDYFENIKDILNSGCLYYTYYAPPGDMWGDNLTHSTVLAHMFPITVQEVHAGWIKGQQRIVTLIPGRYTWNDTKQPQGYFYDATGCECTGTITTITNTDGTKSFDIQFPTGGAAVLEIPATSVSGTVVLDGYVGDEPVAVRVEFRQGSSIVVAVQILGDAGQFSVGNILPGTYDVAVKTYAHLQCLKTNVEISPTDTDLGTFNLVAGDVNGDNEIDSSDLALVLAGLDQTGQ